MKRSLFICILTSALFSCETTISDFQSENFVKFFGSGYESRGIDAVETSVGNYLLTGYDVQENNDKQILLVKTDKNGNQIWSKTYGQTGYNEEGKVVKEVLDELLIVGVADSAGFSRAFILKVGNSGDSLWYRPMGDQDMEIEIADIALDETHIFVAGRSVQPGNLFSDYYMAKLTLDAELVWQRYYFQNSSSSFSRLFLTGDQILFLGNDGTQNLISIVSAAKGSGIPLDFNSLETAGETLADALLVGGDLFILVNTVSGTKLYKLSSTLVTEWKSNSISSITGKSLTMQSNGDLLVLGENIAAGINQINAIVVKNNGETVYGNEVFRTIRGTVSRVRNTTDNGVIIVGSTNATYGRNAQLIKTGADLFLLKP